MLILSSLIVSERIHPLVLAADASKPIKFPDIVQGPRVHMLILNICDRDEHRLGFASDDKPGKQAIVRSSLQDAICNSAARLGDPITSSRPLTKAPKAHTAAPTSGRTAALKPAATNSSATRSTVSTDLHLRETVKTDTIRARSWIISLVLDT